MIGKSNAVLLALLLALPTAFMATAFIAPAVGQPNYSAWLKIVTESWDGDGTDTPVFPAGPGFADRYNATNVCVELYRFKNPNRQDPAPLNSWEGPIKAGSPNGTGFIRVSWPAGWDNVTIIVKAKSYQGDCIGEGNPFQGIIVYWLTINATDSFVNKFGGTGGTDDFFTINDDGSFTDWSDLDEMIFNNLVPQPLNSGPVDVIADVGDISPADFADTFGSPATAWVARAAYIFKLFHEHTWYGTDDVLTYATIFIYDTDHTPANSERSLLQAAITGSDGQSRYTREIYPRAQGLGPNGKFRDNKLVPIPLQTINLAAKTPFLGGIPAPEELDGNIQAPHLNATKRVWWETVLTNQTFYVGNEYNGTGDYAPVDSKLMPLFGAFPADPATSPTWTQGGITGVPAGPFSLALNNTVPAGTAPGFESWGIGDQENVANFNNNTVFYARFCVQDADLKIQHPEVGDKLVGAEVTVNLKRTGVVQPYYLSHNILETDASGCTANPHKWPGYRSEFSKFARFPNATNWGLRGSLNVSKFFDPRDDRSPAWRPGGYFERAWGGAWTGPYVNAGRNWSALIPEITYMKTRTLADDPNYDGFDVQVKWKGGSRNNYGGTAVLVDSIRVPNPYAIALLYDYVSEGLFGGWVFPYTVLANNKLWIQIHTAAGVDMDLDGNGSPDVTVDDPNPTTLEIMGPFTFSITDFDTVTGTYDITITATGVVVVNNATDLASEIDYVLDIGGTITIDDALASIKKHDILGLLLTFQFSGGQVDLGADGRDDFTTTGLVIVRGGPYELEIWPGPPGTATIRVLVTGHDLEVLPPILDGYTGAILFKGTLEFLVFEEVERIDVVEEVFEGGVPTFGPIVKALITDALFDNEHTIKLETLFDTEVSATTIEIESYSTGSSFDDIGIEEGDTIHFMTDTEITVPADELLKLQFVTGGTITVNGEDVTVSPGQTITFTDPDNDITVEIPAGITVTVIDISDPAAIVFNEDGVLAFLFVDTTVTLDAESPITISSFIVPLTDMRVDDRHLDDYLFGGYDDFALTGTGMVYITAWVHDIAFKPVDNMGNTLPASNTAVTLIRYNGPNVVRSGTSGFPDQIIGNLDWSYGQWAGADTGYAIFYQLPGDQAYGVTVTYEGIVVYQDEFQIEKLVETEIQVLVTDVFKLKLVVVDCEGTSLSEPYLNYTAPNGRNIVTRIGPHGELDIIGGGQYVIRAIWWKGVWTAFDKAMVGSTEIPVGRDGSVTITLDRNFDSPITLRAVINDFIFTTWDFNKDNRIPRLNITLAWVGVHPLTGSRMYFLETMDPTGDTDSQPFNTTIRVSQFFNYSIKHFFGQVSRSAGLKTYGDVRYIFYKMPSTYYNITVTTVTNSLRHDKPGERYDPETQQTPGNSKWPGRTDAAVDHEIKIDWTGHTSPPKVRKTPATVNDRVVLRVYMTLGGQPVTDPDLNPIGNATLYTTCGPRNIDLLTWAHTYWQRIVDGDFDYLRDARRIGNATYHIVNDNGVNMEQYIPSEGVFSSSFTSKWTEDTLLTTWLKADSQHSSTIWWNGTYRKQDLYFLSYVYPLQFTRGEEPWARFYDRVGLTGTGTETTQRKETNDPLAYEVNRFFNVTAYRERFDPSTGTWSGPIQNATWPTHNFTVVGTEGLWNQQKWRWEYAVSERLVPEVPYQPYSLVIERPTQELVPVSQKGVLTVPIPVGFITLNLKDEDLARAIPYAVVQLDIHHRGAPAPPPPPPPPPTSFCDFIPVPSTLVATDPAAATAIIASVGLNRTHVPRIDAAERRALCVEIYGLLTDTNSPNAIDLGEATSISTLLNVTVGGPAFTPYNITELMLIINAIKGLVVDGTFTSTDASTIALLFGPPYGTTIPILTDLVPTAPPPPPAPAEIPVRFAGYKYKTGRDGNLTLLFPTQEMMENILSTTTTRPYVVNYTLTVYWYLNSSIVYKDAFNLTKRGYNVEKVAIADVTFVLAISANKDRPVKDLYARIWWFNVSTTGTGAGDTVFPGRITVDHARKTWTYTAVSETRGAAKWTDGKITLPWLPTSERFTKSDYDLVFDTATNRWVYKDVTRSWDIPFPTNNANTGVRHPGWPYQPTPTNYYEALNGTQNARIQYRISVWSDQLPIDPASPSYNNGAWLRDHYELVWRQPSYFGFAWMLFGHPPFDITFYRGPTGVGEFRHIPGYALTRTWERTPTPGSKTVAIKLNATDIEIPVFWQVGDLELGTYDCGPLVDYVVKGQVIPPKGATFGPRTINDKTKAGTITVGDKTISICLAGKPVGLVSLRSGDTPSTVIWGGSTLRITEVSPPDYIWADSTSPAAGKGTSSDYWKNWVGSATDPVTGKKVSKLWEEEPARIGDQTPGPDLGIQYMGYGVPYEGAPREHTVIAFSNDPDNRAHRPFIKMFEFQNVSARITDFNGRALPGAFYQLIDSQTGKSAAWSYAGPEGRVVPMPIRKPGGVFIQRVFYLGHGPDGVPTWPVNSFAIWPVAYDSREDETTQETQKPDIPLGFTYTVEAGPWPTGTGWLRSDACTKVGDGVFNYTRRVLEHMASCPPAGWGRSFDVITRIFDLRLRFVYGDAQRPADPYYEFSAPSLALPDQFKITGQGAIFDAKRLARGTYDIVAYWPGKGGAEVGRRTVDISRSNVGTVEGTVVLALRDVSFTVVDRQGRPLSGARVSVSPDLVRTDDIQLRPDQIFTLLRVPDGRTYDFTIEWTSPYGTTARAAVRETPAGLQARGSIVLLVDDVTINVVDFDGRPVAGADVTIATEKGETDSQGIVIFSQVPLDNDYTISVSKEGTEIGSDRVRFTASRTSATIQAGLYDITVLVKGAAGQPIQGALVELIKGGTPIATAATDASGTAVFTKVVGAEYSVKAEYERFSSTASLPKGTRSAQITLELYTVLLGVPMTLATFLALIIGLILLVVVVAVIVSEYIRWRGRRLGIYPAAPPKK